MDDPRASQVNTVPGEGRDARRRIARFGPFEVDLRTEELRRSGIRIKLQGQPFQVLSLLLERPGEIVTRDEIIDALWGKDVFVDFDQAVGAILRKLRRALGDSASSPRYIETLRHKGYRFLAPCETEEVLDVSTGAPARRRHLWGANVRRSYMVIGLNAAICLASILGVWSMRPSTITDASARENSPQSMDAYLAYQKGRYLWGTRDTTAVTNSIAYFQQALDLDPKYAPAYAGMANAYAILNFYTGAQRTSSIDRARNAARRALELDPSLVEALATDAYIKFYYEWDWPGAETAFRRAISLDPDYATARQWYAEYLFYMGRFQEAMLQINRAHELDPQSVVISLQLASPHLYAREYVQAIDKIQEALRLDPDFPLALYMLGTCYEQLGRFEEAVVEYRKIADTKLGLTGLGYAYGKSGRLQEAREVLRQLLRDAEEDDLSAYHVARVYAGLGENKETFRWLTKAHAARDERLVMLRVDPKLDTLRSNPLFRDFLRDLRLL